MTTDRKQRWHVMALTYEPKIEPVRSGKCTQTIRPDKDIEAGDLILFHGWTGRPYRSPWSWRHGRVTVSQVVRVRLFPHAVYYPFFATSVPWRYCSNLAHLDGFQTWKQMHDYFKANNDLTAGPLFVVIRWTPIEKKED